MATYGYHNKDSNDRIIARPFALPSKEFYQLLSQKFEKGDKKSDMQQAPETKTNTILYYTILGYTMLFYIILYYNITYYTMLYYTDGPLPGIRLSVECHVGG